MRNRTRIYVALPGVNNDDDGAAQKQQPTVSVGGVLSTGLHETASRQRAGCCAFCRTAGGHHDEQRGRGLAVGFPWKKWGRWIERARRREQQGASMEGADPAMACSCSQLCAETRPRGRRAEEPSCYFLGAMGRGKRSLLLAPLGKLAWAPAMGELAAAPGKKKESTPWLLAAKRARRDGKKREQRRRAMGRKAARHGREKLLLAMDRKREGGRALENREERHGCWR
jgi:hypothetical protein